MRLRRTRCTERHEQLGPMPQRFYRLADYNAEVARGIVHTTEWDETMRELQADFNEWASR